MALVYTSRDAYNGCLSLFSDEEALHRGFSKMRISGDVSKTANGYEFKISRISAAHKLPILVNDDYEKNGLDPEACSDYTIPNTAYAKIILTTDASLFPSQQQRFRVTLQFSNFDFTDLAAWPPLNPGLGRLFATSSDGECSVSLGIKLYCYCSW